MTFHDALQGAYAVRAPACTRLTTSTTYKGSVGRPLLYGRVRCSEEPQYSARYRRDTSANTNEHFDLYSEFQIPVPFPVPSPVPSHRSGPPQFVQRAVCDSRVIIARWCFPKESYAPHHSTNCCSMRRTRFIDSFSLLFLLPA